MKVALRLLIILFCFCPGAVAQSTLSNFSFNGSAIGFSATNGTQPAVLAGANYNLTSRVQVGYWALAVPAISSSYQYGVVGYGLPLSSIIGKSLSSKINFDASAVGVNFQAGLGKVLQTTTPIGSTTSTSTSRFAEIVGIAVTFPLTSTLSFNAVEAYWTHGGISGTSGFFLSPAASNFASIGMGLSLAIAPKVPTGADFKHLLVRHGKQTVRLNHCAQC